MIETYKGTAIVYNAYNSTYWLVDENNKKLTDIGFTYIGPFKNDYAICTKDFKATYIKYTGEYLKKDLWFDHCEQFYHNIAIVRNNKKFFFINLKGDNIFNVEFDRIIPYDPTAYIVKLYKKQYKLHISGYII
jgi:hypothetical protein